MNRCQLLKIFGLDLELYLYIGLPSYTKEPRTFVAPKKKTVCSCKGVGGFEVQMLEISVDFEI